MTTKLLLAGPPGTGKTSFARALCNTLQIPLIVTSVTTWLEPGYLGDVLRRMKAAFTEAEANKLAILFVDEIDGIGKRGNASRSFDEYWTSFITRR
ncbi:ATP-binding protein [Mesorhizobium sp. M1396]|uniref:ATP-binding protein n=1 Tax=Mesorhizobium sp. M1396 TaxID=2957095 RepID=UPI003334B30C